MPTNIPDASGNGAGMILGDPNTSSEVNVNIAKNTAGTSNPVIIGATYQAPQPILSPGDTTSLMADARGGLIVSTGSNPVVVRGDVAHDAADSGNPIKVGGYASNAAPTGVQDGDRVNAWFGRNGQQFVTLTTNTGGTIGIDTPSSDGIGTATQSIYVNSQNYVYNGTGFDRLRGNTTGLFVAGVQPGPRPVLNNGDTAQLQMDTRANLAVGLYGVNSVTAVGTPTIGSDGYSGSSTALLTLSPGLVFNGTNWDRARKPNACSRLISSAATTNATSVKASAGNVIKIIGNNTVGNKRYLKLYDKASAPIVGTDTPIITLVIPVSASFTFDLTDQGFYFATGIAYAITGAAADADTTAIGAGDIECLNILYTN